jgi:glycosyltransferase involved in cell wall biosynthesis
MPYLWKNDYDIIHIHGFRKIETYFALLFNIFKKKKIVLTAHNPFPTTSRSSFQEYLIKLHDYTVGKLFVRYINKIIVLVDSEKDIFMRRFGVKKENLIRIPDALNDKFYQEGDPEQFYKDWDINPKKWNGIVVSAGRINYAKGFQNLYKSVKGLPKVLFFIAGGDDGYLSRLKVLFADCENIIFSEHFLSAEKLVNMYAAADIFAFPSLHEAFGMVLLEALAQGTPVIWTNKGGPNDFITEEVGMLLEPTDQDLWLNSIKQMLKDKEKLESMGTKAKELSLKYSWEKQINKIIKIYKS